MYKKGFALIIIITLGLCACAGPSSQFKKNVIAEMQNNNFENAISKIKDNKDDYGSRDESLYFLDLSIPQTSLYQNTDALESLNKAELLQDALFAQSVSAKVGSFVVNDYTEPYRLLPFEQAYLYFYKAQNYLALNDKEGAGVEIRKMVHFLDKNRERTGKDIAFLQYFAGLIFEGRGNYSDARICYQNAQNAYNKQDKSASVMPQKNGNNGNNKGMLTILHYNGNVPLIISNQIMIAWKDALFTLQNNNSLQYMSRDVYNAIIAGAFGNSITVSIPSIENIPFNIKNSLVEVNGKAIETELAGNIAFDFNETFTAELPSKITRMIIRSATKYIMSAQARIQGKKESNGLGNLLGSIMSVYNNITEVADTRSWFTLPAQVRVANIYLDEGTYPINVSFLTENGTIIDKKTFENINIKKGVRTIIYVRTTK